jgi:hypothetical protein
MAIAKPPLVPATGVSTKKFYQPLATLLARSFIISAIDIKFLLDISGDKQVQHSLCCINSGKMAPKEKPILVSNVSNVNSGPRCGSSFPPGINWEKN